MATSEGYIRKTTMFGLAAIIWLARPVIVAVRQSTPSRPRVELVTRQSQSKGVHLVGELVAGGAECPRLRTADNTYYTLEGDLHGFKIGDAVEITGELVDRSHCMQDTTVRIITIERAKR